MKRKQLLSLLLALLMIFALCACGSSAMPSPSSMSVNNYKAEYDTPMEASMAYDYSDTASSEEYGGFAAGGEAELAVSTEAPREGDINPDKIIYSADATLETTDFDTALEELAELIKQYGGFVESSSIHGVNLYSSYGRRSADYSIRVPSESFSALMSALSGIGNVPYSHTYTDNITAQYYDTQARLTAYETQEQSLLTMLEKAESVEDLIRIEEKLTDVRYNIDAVKSRLKNWDRQVNYSTVSLSVNEVIEYSPAAKLSYGERLGLSLKHGLSAVGDFFSELLVWLVGALPTIVILVALFFVFRPLLRKWKRRTGEKRAARKVEKAEQREKK